MQCISASDTDQVILEKTSTKKRPCCEPKIVSQPENYRDQHQNSQFFSFFPAGKSMLRLVRDLKLVTIFSSRSVQWYLIPFCAVVVSHSIPDNFLLGNGEELRSSDLGLVGGTDAGE